MYRFKVESLEILSQGACTQHGSNGMGSGVFHAAKWHVSPGWPLSSVVSTVRSGGCVGGFGGSLEPNVSRSLKRKKPGNLQLATHTLRQPAKGGLALHPHH